jgi:hypothetical protein
MHILYIVFYHVFVHSLYASKVILYVKKSQQLWRKQDISVKCYKCWQIICSFDMGSFCVCKMYYARNGGGIVIMHKYWYNNHHIEVNFDSRDDMVCGHFTMTWETTQFIRLQIK